ncbi:SGNH hydrolase domain-containing protein [Marivita hallyeonensis]|uniref:SGNH hydrolase domain-containing protein n=1 Tax=Marivita hallyeonensis TaxID=996342 RepID=UPI0009323B4D|nr:SGNH hydrolase domain-containing protein [Marivita hallyeonensis]
MLNDREDPAESAVLNVSNTDVTRSEVRQFLVALYSMAFILATLGLRDSGPMAFAADTVLVLCGGWCANQLIRGHDIMKTQMICVLQAYFTGLLCCSVVLFAVGWMVFLPSEFLHLGHSLLFAATFATNLDVALLPSNTSLRFDGLLDHLWVPALVAQCCGILIVLYTLMHQNLVRLLLALAMIGFASLLASMIESPIVQMLPIGGLWAFLCGAIPFIAANRYPILRYALILGILNLITALVAVITSGDTMFARVFFAIGISLMYLGSRQRVSQSFETKRRRRWFGMALHVFLWSIPLAQLSASLDIVDPKTPDYAGLIVPCLFLALISWSIWQKVENRVQLSRITPTGVIAALLFANGITTLSSQGGHFRYSQNANAYLHAIETAQTDLNCPVRTEGTLAGLEVCAFGPVGEPAVLIWGDHQLIAMKAGFAEAARRAEVPTIVIAHPNCVPLDGLQTRFSETNQGSGRNCDQLSAQVLQALPHMNSIRQVTLVADWLYYTGNTASEFVHRAPVRLAPTDGTPINVAQQAMYVSDAADRTTKLLTERGIRVSVLRQVPSLPNFDAEIAARSEAPGSWLYLNMPELSNSVTLEDVTARHAEVDSIFVNLSALGRISYVNTWSAFCTFVRCNARGGLSSDYVTSTRLTPSGALTLTPVLEDELLRAMTHSSVRRS